jgi:phospholipid/cholesterol/gamma-HCH transport system ATP-binding protein
VNPVKPARPGPTKPDSPSGGSRPNGATEGDDHVIVRQMTKRFDDYVALQDINMTIRRRQIVVVIGGSGAGKTTLLRLLIGLDKPTSGAIIVDGVDVVPLGERAMNEVRRKFGMVFQYAALLDSLNVLDNVAFPLREHTKLSEKEIRTKVIDKLKILGMENIEKKFPSQLSGGMRKRVGLARALMLDPSIIVYDEPTSGLDPLSSRMVDDLILETRERFGVTSAVISHDMTSALKIADYIFLLSKGRVVGEGTPRDLVTGKSELARQFLDSSGIAADRLLAEREAVDAKSD